MSTFESLTADAQSEQRAADIDYAAQHARDVENLEITLELVRRERAKLHDEVTTLRIANAHLTADNESLKLEVERLRKLRHDLDNRIDRLQRVLAGAL